MVEWNKKYSTGVEDVDEQHRTLFRFLNELDADLQNKIDQRVIIKSLEFLEAYSKIHFSYEEMCMMLYKCSAAEENKRDHKSFIYKVAELKKRIAAGESILTVAHDIHAFIVKWLVFHVMNVDVKLNDIIMKK